MLVYDARCEFCGAPVRWCTGPGGKKIPLDPRPAASGYVITMQSGREVAAPYDAQKHGHQPRYALHPSTCAKRPEAKTS